MKKVIIVFLVLFISAVVLAGTDTGAVSALEKADNTELSKVEEKELVSNLEFFENLDLLMNLELFEDYKMYSLDEKDGGENL